MNHANRVLRGKNSGLRLRAEYPSGDEGNRTSPVAASKTGISEERSTESGTVDAPKGPLDPELALIQERWPKLPEHIRQAVLALIRAHPGGE